MMLNQIYCCLLTNKSVCIIKQTKKANKFAIVKHHQIILKQKSNKKYSMRKIFFEVGETIELLDCNFIETTNKLDSHKYMLQRVQNPVQNYVQTQYFNEPHPQLVTYFNCWVQKQAISEVTSPKIIKKKGGTSIHAMLNRKGKGEGSQSGLISKNSFADKATNKEPKQQKQAVTSIAFTNLSQSQTSNSQKQCEVLYIQLQSFGKGQVKMDYEQGLIHMSIVYLLAQKVHHFFTQPYSSTFSSHIDYEETKNLLKSSLSKQQESNWPMMNAVTGQDGKLKFLKRGKTLNEEMYRLFKSTFPNEQNYKNLPQDMICLINKADINGGNDKLVLIEDLKNRICEVINNCYPLKIYRGNIISVQNCKLTANRDLLLIDSKIQIPLNQFQIQYSYSHQQNRQIELVHEFLQPIVLIGNRANFLIRYLKQFKNT